MNTKIALARTKGKIKKLKEFASSIEYWAKTHKNDLDKILESLESIENNINNNKGANDEDNRLH